MSEVLKELPEGWADAQINHLAERITKGSTPTSYGYEYKTEGIKFIKAENIDATGHATTTSNYIDDETHEFLARSQLKQNDLLFSIAGTIGRVGIVRDIDLPANTNQALAIIRLADKTIDVKYLYYYLNSPQIQTVALNKIVGVGRANLSLANIGEFRVPVAPPEHQKRIVAKIEELFSHIDAGIEALKKAQQLLKQYRQSVLKAAVTGELTKEWREANMDKLEPASQLLMRVHSEREQEFKRKLAEWVEELIQWKGAGEKGKKPAKPKKLKELEPISEDNRSSLGDLPEGWIWVKLGNLSVDVFDGPFGSNLKSSDYVEEGIRVIRLENIGNLEFKDEKKSFITPEKYELLKKHTVSNGDLIFSSFVADGTRVVVLPKQIEKAINKADCFCVRCYGNSVYNYYLSLFLATNMAYKRLENEVHGATRPRINTTQLKNIEVPICSIIEQKEAARILELKFETTERMNREINEKLLMLDKNKQSILSDAFSGKLVEQLEGDEPASLLLQRIREKGGAEKRKPKGKRGRVVKKSEVSMRRAILDVLKEEGEPVEVSLLMQKAGFDSKEVEEFYYELSDISDLIKEVRPGKAALKNWPYEEAVSIKLSK